MKRKYKLLARVSLQLEIPVDSNAPDAATVSTRVSGFRRVKALVDIPRYGVKAGDIGGYVSSGHILRHDDDCWIADDAVVCGNTTVMGDAFIGGNAVLMGENPNIMLIVDGKARIDGNAWVQILKEFPNWDYVLGLSRSNYFSAFIHEDVHITDHALIRNFFSISGSVQIDGNARIENAKYIDGECKITENALLMDGNSVTGASIIRGTTIIGAGTVIQGNSKIGTPGKMLRIPSDRKFTDATIRTQTDVALRSQNSTVAARFRRETRESMKELAEFAKSVEFQSPHPTVPDEQPREASSLSLDEQKISIQTLDDISCRVDSYQKDIVKIIKYPLMIDTTDPYTAKMMMLFNKAQRLREFSGNRKFSETVDALEEAFLAAEANALKLSSTTLPAADQKKAAQATDLLRIAMDDAASENEKQIALKQGLKQLEGVILVPDEAVEIFRVKAGIGQLTM